MRGGELRLAKTPGMLAFVWSWPEINASTLDPTMVVVSREPDGRWYVTFAIDAGTPAPLPPSRQLVVTGRWYPSSKTCSKCKFLLSDLPLSARTWRCPSCGARHDRDINAAKNILAAGLAVARSDPGDACGADVRHLEVPPVQSAVKQEPRLVTAGIPVLQGGE
jgi:hypothetical protein